MAKNEPKGVKCLSFQQPYATMIATGVKTVECRSRKIVTPIKNLVVCGSKTAKDFYPLPGLAYGYAIGMVDVVDCVPFKPEHLDAALMTDMPAKDCYAWILENPRLIEPYPVHASASFFYTDFEPKVIESSADSYIEHFAELSQEGDDDLAAAIIWGMFEERDLLWEIFYGVGEEEE